MQFYDTKSYQIIDIKPSEVTNLIKTKWDEIHSNTNAFRYKIDTEENRLVNNNYLLQLIPNRGTKRRIPEHIKSICQAFDMNKFNFCKISKDEEMFCFNQGEDTYHTVLINMSPINKYHSLLCPFLEDCLPQIITKDSLVVAVKFLIMAENRDLRLGYNSLFAMASVNHLHFHIFIEKHDLPVETVKCKQIKGSLYCFDSIYPIPAFCFEITSIETNIDDIYKLLEYFLKNNIAHNIFMTRGCSVTGNDSVLRILIFPRKECSVVKEFNTVNIACCELSGWFPVYSAESFNNMQEDDLENELRNWRIDDFEKLCEDVKTLY